MSIKDKAYLKLKFCEYTGLNPRKPINEKDLDWVDWNSFRRVCREEGCSNESLLEALQLEIND